MNIRVTSQKGGSLLLYGGAPLGQEKLGLAQGNRLMELLTKPCSDPSDSVSDPEGLGGDS